MPCSFKNGRRKNPQYGQYEFMFQDNGIGMTEEFLKVLFEPFTRAEDSRTSRVTGTGLGMTIARNLVRMMDGDIQVSSTVNQGTQFTVTLQLKLQNYADDAEDLRNLSVLVVDDDGAVSEGAAIMLQELQMSAEWCLSGQEAVELATRRHREKGGIILLFCLTGRCPVWMACKRRKPFVRRWAIA